MEWKGMLGAVAAVGLGCAAIAACGSAHSDEGADEAVANSAFVVMNADGTVRYGRGVDGSNPLTTGKFPDGGGYQVLFTRDISACAAVASVRGPAAGVIPPAFAVVGRSSAQQVTVSIFRYDGTSVDADFEITVIC